MTKYYVPFEKITEEYVDKKINPTENFELTIINQFFPPDYAATGQFIYDLAEQFRLQGKKVHVFTSQPGYAYDVDKALPLEEIDNLLIRRSCISRIWAKRVRGKTLNGLLFCLRTALHLCRKKWQAKILLLTTAPPFLQVTGYLCSLLFKLDYVCLVYDLYPDVVVELKVLPQKHWLVNFWNDLNLKIWRRAKSIIVLSETMKQRIVDRFPRLEEKIKVIHNWADPNWIVPMPKNENWFAYKYNLVNKFTVSYSGNLGMCHDLQTILDAAILLKDEPIQFVFIGDGGKKAVCQQRVREHGLENVLFLPFQDREVLPYSLTSCDLSLVSVAEGMEGVIAPSKLYGILAAGRPVAAICEDSSYLHQLVKDAGCGKTFAHRDGFGLAKFIVSLTCSPQKAEQMGQAGRDYLQANFTPKVIAQQYAEVLF